MIKSLPVIPLRGLTVFPTMVLSFDISRERSIRAVEEAMATDQAIFLVTQLDPDDTNPGLQNLYEIGVVANVLSVAKLPKDILRVRVEGVERGRLLEADEQDSYLRAQVQVLKDSPVEIDEITGEAMTRGLEDLLTRYGQINQKFGKDMLRQLLEIHQTEELTTAACVHLPVHYEERQRLLETDDLTERYNLLCTVLVREIEILQVQTDIQQKVKARVDKNQREYVLREQIKVIQEELGEDTLLSDVKHYEEAAAELQASDEVRNKIIKESERLKSIGMNSAENSVLRGYIETLLELPWDKASVDSHDLKHARKILDQDHYGLEKVKERVLEFLAVRCLTEKGDSPIICLVGPPGTGKTSIAQSIARALDKKFVRISLGGVRDEAEIRGHRRTYVGAMPGRIVDGLRQAGVKNPLMLLDEIDKVSSDYRGDTSSALLEVLDSEQNYRFRDNYVELPIDLSGVLFIATANDVHTIPRPLLDRMEIIEVTSYTANEKFHIAREHLLKKQMAHNGLKKGQLTISKSAMASLIDGYTREAGVRQLERRLGELCRKAAREILEDGASSVRITEKNLVKYLGRKHSQILKKTQRMMSGLCAAWRGPAWAAIRFRLK